MLKQSTHGGSGTMNSGSTAPHAHPGGMGSGQYRRMITAAEKAVRISWVVPIGTAVDGFRPSWLERERVVRLLECAAYDDLLPLLREALWRHPDDPELVRSVGVLDRYFAQHDLKPRGSSEAA